MSSGVVKSSTAGGAAPAAKPAAPRSRITSVDIARGFTMFWMIMVDNQGSHTPGDIWYPWRESDWNGIGPADCVFPAFLFLAGFSITLALSKHRAAWAKGGEGREAVVQAIIWKVIPRFVKLFAIGAFINLWAGGFKFDHWVIMGVLQRIAVCYLVMALSYIFLPSLWLVRTVPLAALVLYAGIMYGVDVPGCGRAVLTPGCNAGGWASRQLWGAKHVPADGTIPEALVSTLAAIVTTEAGLEFGLIMRGAKQYHKAALLVLWLTACVAYAAVGAALTLAVPVNKKIWSPPFALLVSAVAGAMMAAWLFIVDLRCGADMPAEWWRFHWMRTPILAPAADRSTSLNRADRVAKAGAAKDLQAPLLGAAAPELPLSPTLLEPPLSSLPDDAPLARCCGAPCCEACDSPAAVSAFDWAAWVSDVLVCQPLTWLGRNPALTFIAMVGLEVLLMDTLKPEGTPVWTTWYEKGFVPGTMNRQAASSAVALVHVALWVAICGILHRFKVYITL